MTDRGFRVPPSVESPALGDVRSAAHGAGTAACIALLTFLGELALDFIPVGSQRDDGARALERAARLAAGGEVNPDDIANALMDESETGLMIYQQEAPDDIADAWGLVVGELGYAAYHGSLHLGEPPNSMLENYALDEALDMTVDLAAALPGLDWKAVEEAATYVRENGSEAVAGWGNPLDVADLRKPRLRSR